MPWKLAHAEPETAYVGLSYKLRPPTTGSERFVTCCAQVFDADGAGLEFIAYETADYRIFGDNPFLSRAEMRRVMARSLMLYQQRHAGRVPRRVVVHKTTEFKEREIEGVFDALGHIATVELVQVKQESGWRGLRMDAPSRGSSRGGEPAKYPLERGTLLALGGSEALLWTAGNAPEAVNGRNFFKEGKGVPDPLMLVRHAGHGGWEDTAAAVLGLTKVNWNNDALYDRLPVTLGSRARSLRRSFTCPSWAHARTRCASSCSGGGLCTRCRNAEHVAAGWASRFYNGGREVEWRVPALRRAAGEHGHNQSVAWYLRVGMEGHGPVRAPSRPDAFPR